MCLAGGVTSGYTVTINYSGLYPNVCFYSLDNGTTWIDGYVAGQTQLVLNNVKQIKFKGENYEDYFSWVSVPSLSVSMYVAYGGSAQYSDNFVLTQDVTDVTICSGID